LNPSNNVIRYYPIKASDLDETCAFAKIRNRNTTLIKKPEIQKLLGKPEGGYV
jgi:hypothetical protein